MSETPTLYDDVKPIIDPILMLLKSRKAIVALITAGVDLLVLAVPSLTPNRDALLTIFTSLGLGLMGFTTAEDVSKNHETAKVAVAEHAANAVVMAAKVGNPPVVVTTPER